MIFFITLIILIYFIINNIFLYLNNKKIFKEKQIILPKIYVINLDRSKDRLQNIQKEFNNNKITNFERFNGIDGSKYKLNKKELFFFRNLDNKEKYLGLIGCALSHFYIWKKMIDYNIQDCIITEDDITLKNNFSNNLKQIISIKNDYELIFLYHNRNYLLSMHNKIIPYNKLKWYGCGAVMYYINNKAAHHLYQKVVNQGIHRAIDWFIYEEVKKIKVGISKVSLVNTGSFNSVIGINNL